MQARILIPIIRSFVRFMRENILRSSLGRCYPPIVLAIRAMCWSSSSLGSASSCRRRPPKQRRFKVEKTQRGLHWTETRHYGACDARPDDWVASVGSVLLPTILFTFFSVIPFLFSSHVYSCSRTESHFFTVYSTQLVSRRQLDNSRKETRFYISQFYTACARCVQILITRENNHSCSRRVFS